MYGQNAGRDKPGLVFPGTGISDDKYRKQGKKGNGIAIAAHPNPVGAINAQNLNVPILQNHKGFVAQ